MTEARSFHGTYRVKLTCASPAQMLEKINIRGIPLYNVEFKDELTVHVTVRRRDYPVLRGLVTAGGNLCEILKRSGLFWTLKNALKRPVLLFGILFYSIALCFLPTRILFVQVEGNQNVPSRLILEKASICGIAFGASRSEVRSERMKNALLGALPQLQWAGVNTRGCVAVISVRERSLPDEGISKDGVSSIVSKADCVIRDVTVVRGNPLCAPGQAVKSGQILVSGYTDCGLSVKAERAEGEIFGETSHAVMAKMPLNVVARGEIVDRKTKFSLKIGKNIINLTKGSGISGAGCVKMYSEYYVLLPGGFRLPFAVIKETSFSYETASVELTDADFSWVETRLDQYLLSDMQAGKILQRDITGQVTDGCFTQYGKYSCLEQVGRVRNEEILEEYGKGNGTDSERGPR